jgi:hypothetical protein
MRSFLEFTFGAAADALAATGSIEPFGLLDLDDQRVSLISFCRNPTDDDIARFLGQVLDQEPRCGAYAVVYEAHAVIDDAALPGRPISALVPRPHIVAGEPGADVPAHAIFVVLASRTSAPQLWRSGVTDHRTLTAPQNVTDAYDVPHIVPFPSLQ